LFRFQRGQANLRVLEVDELKTVPRTPRSHAFVERLIGTIRREYLDRIWFLEPARSRAEARELQGLLQSISLSHRTVGHDTGAKEWCTRAALGASRLIPLAKALRWLVSDSLRRVKVGIRHTLVVRVALRRPMSLRRMGA
jgi:hypothetical protein